MAAEGVSCPLDVCGEGVPSICRFVALHNCAVYTVGVVGVVAVPVVVAAGCHPDVVAVDG